MGNCRIRSRTLGPRETMSTVRGKRRGFTIMKAIVSIALTTLGILGAMGALGSLTKAQTIMLQTDRMDRLAYQKYQEILATQDYNTTSGDFKDWNDDKYVWEASINSSSVQN